ncbi:MAG TPA: hypothetical protein VGB41_02680 [Acidimicrobiia bacterium]
MSRLPNPWIAVPVLIAAIGGGAVGFFVTDASCAPGSCPIASSLAGALAAIVAGAGIGVIAVLALKSLDEFRTHRDREILTAVDADAEDPGPPGR